MPATQTATGARQPRHRTGGIVGTLAALTLVLLMLPARLHAQGSISLSPAPGSPFAVGMEPFSVAVGDFTGDGTLDLATANLLSGTVTVLLGDGHGQFVQASGSPVAVGPGPASVAVGDFNRDGKLDLVTANTFAGTVTILLGNGQGQFTQAIGSPVTVGGAPASVAVADFTGDGAPDLAVANQGSNSVTILLGNGQGQFTQATGSPITAGTQPISVAVGRFNGDAHPDLAVANSGSNSVMILLGNGQGQFIQASGSPVPVGNQPLSVVAGDFTGDGALDLAVANSGSNSLTILLGDGEGQFTQASGSPIPLGGQPSSLVAGALTADGKLDLAVTNASAGTVTILLGNGLGGFGQPAGSPVAVGINPVSVAVGDFAGSGKLGVAVADATSNSVTVLLNTTPVTTTGCFALASGSPIKVGTYPQGMAVADFTGDGALDLAVPNALSANVTILLGDGLGQFTPASGSPVAVGVQPVAALAASFTSSGTIDLAVVDANQGMVTILLGNGQGQFTQARGSPVAVGDLPFTIAAADFNRDGTPDLATANVNSGNVTILLGNGDGQFTQASGSPIAVGIAPSDIAAADFTSDGMSDLAVANAFSNSVTILLGNGAGQFTQASGSPIILPGNGQPDALAVGDFNRDGKVDLAVANSNSASVTILLGQGDGQFTQAGSPIPVGTAPASIAVGDFDNDGTLDLAVAAWQSNILTILLGKGDGSFSEGPGSPITVGSEPITVKAADLTNQGTLDLAVTNRLGATVAILLGDAPCPPPSEPPANCRAPGRVCHASLSRIHAKGRAVIATGSIAPGPCPWSDNCLRLQSQDGLVVDGLLRDVPAETVPIVRLAVTNAAGRSLDTLDVTCGQANAAGRVRCSAVVPGPVFPQVEGVVDVLRSRDARRRHAD